MKVVNVFFTEYPALLRLESDMMISEMPTRPADNKALQAHFAGRKTAGHSKGTASQGEEGNATSSERPDDITTSDKEGRDADGAQGGAEKAKMDEKLPDEQVAQLRQELQAVTSCINGGSKLKTITNPVPPMNETWVRLSKVKSDATHQPFRGSGLIEHHTFEWGKEVGPSRHRFATTLAQLCILEQAIVNTYRHALLNSPDSSAAFLRLRIEEATQPYRVKPAKTHRQTTLTQKAAGQAQDKFIWADRLSYDVDATGMTSFNLEDEIGASHMKALRDDQRQEVQKFVSAIEDSPTAWAVNTVLRDREYMERQPVRPQIQKLIEQLVKVRCLSYHIATFRLIMSHADRRCPSMHTSSAHQMLMLSLIWTWIFRPKSI